MSKISECSEPAAAWINLSWWAILTGIGYAPIYPAPQYIPSPNPQTSPFCATAKVWFSPHADAMILMFYKAGTKLGSQTSWMFKSPSPNFPEVFDPIVKS